MKHDAHKTYTIKIAVLLIMIFLTKIPITLMTGLTAERGTRQSEAQNELSKMTGGAQQMVGPFLVVKTTDNVDQSMIPTTGQTPLPSPPSKEKKLRIVPSELTVNSHVAVERRYRGIYPLETFVATTSIKGVFDFTGHETDTALRQKQITSAALNIGITSPDFILSVDDVKWGENALTADTGTAEDTIYETGVPIHADVPISTVQIGNKIPFSLSITLRGSGSFSISPVAERWQMTMTSNSAFPSFTGGSLPVDRKLSDQGFTANWRMEKYGKRLPAIITERTNYDYQQYLKSSAGVSFGSGINTYEMVNRAIKYSLLFITLTFAIFFLFEVICGLRLHSVQYGLIASALCIFYLLLLSLSEYCSFSIAYGVAVLMAVSLVSGYSRAILSSTRQANLVACLLTTIYGYLYVVLGDREYALLLGSIGVTIVLAIIMYLTRNVDWYDIGGKSKQDEATIYTHPH